MAEKPFVAPKNKEDQIKRRQDVLKWNGWGYKDTYFYLRDDDKAAFNGPRYRTHGQAMPSLKQWMMDRLRVNVDYTDPAHPELTPEAIPKPIRNEAFMVDLAKTKIAYSEDCQDRLYRGHGQGLVEIYHLRIGKLERVPDLVVWPEDHLQAETIVQLATKHNAVLIPFGGGTCVSNALVCPIDETRTIISVDTSEMNRILWIDPTNLTMRAQAGIIGQDLERQLADRGFCTGHEPDSTEFSTLGGWVATRASGMKKNAYGNIEDMLVHVRLVTPKGVIEKSCQVPRLSAGPDIHHFILGSEGTLGLITEVTLKIRPLPQCQRYGSIVFPDFQSGVKCLRELAYQRCIPTSIRLMDNEQFQLGRAMKLENHSIFGNFVESLKKMYLLKFKGFDPLKMTVATLLFEGTKEEVDQQEKKVYAAAALRGGIPGGAENGQNGYLMTFVIAYIRDIAYDYCIISDSFETSVPWDRCLDLCQNVKERLIRETKNRHFVIPAFVTCRVTQCYDAGACVYFYFGFNHRGMAKPCEVMEEIVSCGRAEIIANGGSISHHHGVGKVRSKWMKKTIGELGVGTLKAIKKYIDPENIFGVNNMEISSLEKSGIINKSIETVTPDSETVTSESGSVTSESESVTQETEKGELSLLSKL